MSKQDTTTIAAPVLIDRSKLEMPNGYSRDYDSKIWNVGWLFSWSKYYQRWMDHDRAVTVKPRQTIREVLAIHVDEDKRSTFTILFRNV